LAEQGAVRVFLANNFLIKLVSDILIWIKLFRFLKQIAKRGKGGFKDFYGRGKLAVGLKHKELDRSRNCYKNLLQPFADKVCIVKTKRDLQFFIKSLDV